MSMGRVPNSEDIEWAARRVMGATEWLHTARHIRLIHPNLIMTSRSAE
jgi:hypothetical protein